jgi:hypothetical protein
MAGANTRNDIDAGEALGKAVAGKFTARARTDRAGAAIGTPTYWSKLEQLHRKGRIPCSLKSQNVLNVTLFGR